MSEEKKSITLENKRLASMGDDTIVIIPRKLVQYKILNPDKLYDIIFIEKGDVEKG